MAETIVHESRVVTAERGDFLVSISHGSIRVEDADTVIGYIPLDLIRLALLRWDRAETPADLRNDIGATKVVIKLGDIPSVGFSGSLAGGRDGGHP
jgi:hypothetical protein